MPTRRIPRTDDERSAAMSVCAAKAQNTPLADRLITPAQDNTLNGTLSPWRARRDAIGPALQAQTAATESANTTYTTLVRVISHYIQVINFAIERGVLPASTRSYYQLPVTHAEVPVINTCAQALLWAGHLASGETARVADGGPAMAWPAIAEVNIAATACADAENTQSGAKSGYDIAQEDVAEMRPQVDVLIKDLWDTIEYNLRADAPPSLRRKAREWGVVYDGEEEAPAPPAPAPPSPPTPPTP